MLKNNILVLLSFLVICLVNLTAQSPSHPNGGESNSLKMATAPVSGTHADSAPVEEKPAGHADSSVVQR
jgi:hypothetical protein